MKDYLFRVRESDGNGMEINNGEYLQFIGLILKTKGLETIGPLESLTKSEQSRNNSQYEEHP